MHKTKVWRKRALPLFIALITSAAVPLWAEKSTPRPPADEAEVMPAADPEAFLLAIWTETPLNWLALATDARTLPRVRAVDEESHYLATLLPRRDVTKDGRVILHLPEDPGDVGDWGIYLLPGWPPQAILQRSLIWVRQHALAFKEGSGRLPDTVELQPEVRDPGEIPERVPDEREIPAGERFAELPRFGMKVFRAEEARRRAIPEEVARREEGEDIGAVAGQPVPPSYIIGPGDELAVRVWTKAVEHVAVRATVSTEGTVYLMLLGEVTVGGRSLADVREMLSEGYHQYFDEVQVSVALARTRVIEVRVTGDATRPGKYRLSGAATVFSALYAAHGPGEIGSLRDIRLVRRGEAPHQVDMYAYLLEGDASADVLLEPEDTIMIPPAGPMVGLTGKVQRPARYELSEENTIAEALEMAGGLTATGDPRRVEVWRIAEDGQRRLLNIDLTDASQRDLPVASGDLIVVEPVLEDPHNVVEVAGAVTRPGSYEFREGMTVGDLLARAQGIIPNAHVERAWIWRLNDQLKYEQMRLDLAGLLAGLPEADVGLHARDRVMILFDDEVEAPSEVEVSGAVRKPGVVTWRDGMRVSDLVKQGGGLLEGAFTTRANLLRLTADQQREIIPVKLGDALTGAEDADLLLARGDRLEVLKRSEVAVEGMVEVGGYVGDPGRYRRHEGMRISDAIIAAGGLAAGAGREIQYTSGGDRTQVEPIMLSLRRNGAEPVIEPDPIIEDNDLITVLGMGEMVGWPKSAAIQGRVVRPGKYALEDDEGSSDTVYDLLQRAGGLLPDANPNGIILYRLREEILAEELSADLRQVMNTFNRELTADTLEGEEQRRVGVAGQVAEGLQAAFAQHERAIIIPPRRLTQDAWARAVPIDGELMMTTEGEQGNFELVHGDVIIVPEMPTTVTLMGAVIRPGALRWEDTLCAQDYVDRAGGLAPDAQMRRTVVIRANGAVEADGLCTELRPGDIILVPSDYMIREIAKPSTWDRVLNAVTGILGAYLLFR